MCASRGQQNPKIKFRDSRQKKISVEKHALSRQKKKGARTTKASTKSHESKDNLGFIVRPFLQNPFLNFVYRRTVSHLLLGTVLLMPHRLSSSGELASIMSQGLEIPLRNHQDPRTPYSGGFHFPVLLFFLPQLPALTLLEISQALSRVSHIISEAGYQALILN